MVWAYVGVMVQCVLDWALVLEGMFERSCETVMQYIDRAIVVPHIMII